MNHSDRVEALALELYYATAIASRDYGLLSDDERWEAIEPVVKDMWRQNAASVLERIGVKVSRPSRSVEFARWFVRRFKLLSGRWPCPDCGRASASDPLRLIECRREDGGRYSTGCARCNNEDLLAEAEAVVAEEEG